MRRACFHSLSALCLSLPMLHSDCVRHVRTAAHCRPHPLGTTSAVGPAQRRSSDLPVCSCCPVHLRWSSLCVFAVRCCVNRRDLVPFDARRNVTLMLLPLRLSLRCLGLSPAVVCSSAVVWSRRAMSAEDSGRRAETTAQHKQARTRHEHSTGSTRAQAHACTQRSRLPQPRAAHSTPQSADMRFNWQHDHLTIRCPYCFLPMLCGSRAGGRRRRAAETIAQTAVFAVPTPVAVCW